MHVVIMGCGRVGSRLARRLERQGHSVGVIDKDPRAFHLLDVDFKGIKVEGIGFDSEAMEKAGIKRADVFVQHEGVAAVLRAFKPGEQGSRNIRVTAHIPLGAARTVGDRVTSDLIRRYIKRHTAEQATKQPELF